MRKLIVTEWVSLDGFISGVNNDMSFVGANYSPEMGQYQSNIVAKADTLIFGRLTYESFAGSWPHVPEREGVSEGEKSYARALNSMKKIVFSKTMNTAGWEKSSLYDEIDPEMIQDLKEQEGKDILIYGSASVVQQLTNLELIDEYELTVHPVILGAGKKLFDNMDKQVNLKLIETKQMANGVVFLKYQPLYS